MKQTQYSRILSALRKAGPKGCTVRDLLRFTNYPSARIHEMTDKDGYIRMGAMITFDKIERQWREHNGMKLRSYVLRRSEYGLR